MIDQKIKKVYDISIGTDAGVLHIVPKDNVSISLSEEMAKINGDIPFGVKKLFNIEGDFLYMNFIT